MKLPHWLRQHWREVLLALAWLLPILSLLVAFRTLARLRLLRLLC